MNVIEFNSAIYKFHIKNYKLLNKKILHEIEKAGKYSMQNKTSQISNTDWHLSRDFPRTYIDLLLPELNQAITSLKLTMNNYWFQQYIPGNNHGWHTHPMCNYSSVYFVELPDMVETLFKNYKNEEFTVKAKEGDFVVFPSHLEHCSPENKTQTRKTIISINFNLQ